MEDNMMLVIRQCENCLQSADSRGVCENGCRKAYTASCYDCGEPTLPVGGWELGGEHFAMHGCPGFMPASSEYADGHESPEYQRDSQAFWTEMGRLRKEYATNPRPTSYPCAWCDENRVKRMNDVCAPCRADAEAADDLDFNTAEWMNSSGPAQDMHF